MASIYIIKNTINNKVYIGQTIQPISIRFTNHKMASRIEDTKFYRAIRKYGEENFYIELLETVPFHDLNEREKFWIKYYDSYYHGYNSTLGGDGVSRLDYNFIYNEWSNGKSCAQIGTENNISRDVISRILKNEFNISEKDIINRGYEYNHTLSSQFILSKWNDGLTPNQIRSQYGSSIEYIKNVLLNAGISQTEFKSRADDNQRILKCEQILKYWKEGLTITEISKIGGNYHTIHKILIDNGVTSEEISNRKKLHCNQNAKAVVQLTLNNEYIDTFPSALVAAKSLGHKSGSSIGGCCMKKPKYKTAYGFKWMFEEDYMKSGDKNGTQ